MFHTWVKWYGSDRKTFLEKVVVGDIQGLKENEGRLTLVVNKDGNIVDDAVLCNAGDHIYMVVNGACKNKDMDHFREYMTSDQVQMEYMGDTEQSLLALQGDGAKDTLAPLLSVGFDLSKFPFMHGVYTKIGGFDTRLTRCGYTGEDGFEISVRAQDAVPLAKLLLASKTASVQPCGLGARDSLRLEAGLCLYGHDLDENINPVQGALVWTIGPPGSRRRLEPTFLGAHNILTKEGKPIKVDKKRVGLSGHKTPAREGAKIFQGDQEVGVVTSGTVSPCLNVPLAMGYVATEFAKAGTELSIEVRGKRVTTQVAKMPFVPTRYWRVPE